MQEKKKLLDNRISQLSKWITKKPKQKQLQQTTLPYKVHKQKEEPIVTPKIKKRIDTAIKQKNLKQRSAVKKQAKETKTGIINKLSEFLKEKIISTPTKKKIRTPPSKQKKKEITPKKAI